MSTCGERYAGLIKTTLGTTPADPVWGPGGLPDAVDSMAWGTLAETLYARTEAAWRALGELESRDRSTKFKEWNALVDTMNALHTQYSSIGGLWTSAPAARVPELVAFCEQATCVLERIDDASVRLGGQRSAGTSSPGSSWLPEGAGGWALTALVVGGIGYAIYRSEKKA